MTGGDGNLQASYTHFLLIPSPFLSCHEAVRTLLTSAGVCRLLTVELAASDASRLGRAEQGSALSPASLTRLGVRL